MQRPGWSLSVFRAVVASQVSGHGSSTNHQEFFASPDDFRSHELGLALPDRDPEVIGFSVFSAGLVYE